MPSPIQGVDQFRISYANPRLEFNPMHFRGHNRVKVIILAKIADPDQLRTGWVDQCHCLNAEVKVLLAADRAEADDDIFTG